MKKLVLTSAIAASSLFAATDAQILGFYNQILPQGISASIVSREKLAGNEEFEGVEKNNRRQSKRRRSNLYQRRLATS